jgi:hypothetical protein
LPGGAGGSPMQNRGCYKPPQMIKRPAPVGDAQVQGGSGPGLGRSALGDVTNRSGNLGLDGASDLKRQKVGEGEFRGEKENGVVAAS